MSSAVAREDEASCDLLIVERSNISSPMNGPGRPTTSSCAAPSSRSTAARSSCALSRNGSRTIVGTTPGTTSSCGRLADEKEGSAHGRAPLAV
jgi:hypothetical protein